MLFRSTTAAGDERTRLLLERHGALAALAGLVLSACGSPPVLVPSAGDELRPGVVREGRSAPGAAQVWKLDALSDRAVVIDVHHAQGSLTLALRDAEGTVRRIWVSEILEPGLWHCQAAHDPTHAWVTDGGGPWQLRVSASDDATPIDYRIAWTADAPATAEARAAWDADRVDFRVDELLADLREQVGAGAGEHAVVREELLATVDRAAAALESALRDRPLELARRLEGLVFRLYDSVPLAQLEPLGRRVLEIRTAQLPADDLCLAETLGNLATIEHDRGQFDEALLLEQRSLAIKRARLDPADPDLLYSVRQVATILVRGGRCREAAAEVLLLERRENLGPAELAETHLVAGEYYRCIDDYPRARDELERGVAAQAQAAEQGQADARIGRDLVNSLAYLHMSAGDYAAAELRLRENLRELEREGWTKQLATAHLNLGEVCRRQGKLERAAAELERANALATEVYGAASPRLIFFRTSQGRLHEQLGRLDRAEALYRESLSYLDATGEAVLEHGENLNDLARVLRLQGRNDEARDDYRRALELRQRFFGPAHPDVAETLVELARAEYLAAPENDESLDLVERALSVLVDTPARPEARIEAHALHAELLHDRGRVAEAFAALDAALDQVEAQRPRTGGGERALAEVYGRRRELFDRMIDWRLGQVDVAAAWDYVERARARSLLDQMQAAGVDLRRGIPDPLLRAELDEREAQAKREVATCQSRLREVLADADAPVADRRRRIAELEARRDRAYAQLQTVHEETKSASPLWRELVTSGGRLATLHDVQQHRVEPGTLLLAYQIGERASWLLVVPPAPQPATATPLVVGAATAVTLGVDPGPLTAAVLRRVLLGSRRSRGDAPATASAGGGERGLGVVEIDAPRADGVLSLVAQATSSVEEPSPAPLAALAEVLVPSEVWQRLRGATEAIVLPDRDLYRFPLEALVMQPAADWVATRFWLDDGPVVRYAPSGTFLAGVEAGGAAIRAVRTGPDVLTVSDPRFGPATGTENPVDALRGSRYRPLAPLPGTALETRAITEAFGGPAGDRVQALQGAEATEANVRRGLPGKRYVHLATHGLVDGDRSELFASLALTPEAGAEGTDRDGYLQLFEIYDLELPAELVVLSACNSNVGPLVEGEGAFALSRGFFAAGAQRVVASLWPVADVSTAELIGAFFRGVAAAEARGATASHAALLRDAKRHVRSRTEYAAPFHWAPFVLTGAQ